MDSYRDWLKHELEVRTGRRPGYSLRAFSRDLGISPPKVSQVLRGICGISGLRAGAIADKLKFSPAEKALFVAMVEAEHSRSVQGKKQARARLANLQAGEGFGELALERFRVIADWQHFAILELTSLTDFRSDPEWIAARLAVPVAEIRLALARLEKLGLLEATETGELRQTHADLATPTEIPSREMRHHHSQMLKLANAAQDEFPMAERDLSSVTMAIDASQLPEAKLQLREFRRKFCRDVQRAPTKNRVYALCIQFFPLDRPGDKK